MPKNSEYRPHPSPKAELLEKIQTALDFFLEHGSDGEVLLLDADFSPNSVALLLAAIHLNLIVVPVAANVANLDRDRR